MSLATWCTLLLSILSLCQVSIALVNDQCTKVEDCSTEAQHYFSCSNGTCDCVLGSTNYAGVCKKKSTHGENCDELNYCDDGVGLNCLISKCLCNAASEYWNTKCYRLADIAIAITPTPETNRINLAWTVTTPNGDNITGFTYSIMNGTKSIGANSNGGSISELVSGTKYTFTVVAQPPSYTSITYSSRNISTVEIWTKSKHGESCLSASCDNDLTCQNNKICTCNLTTQYWVNRCYSLADIAIRITPTPETNRINLEWTVTTPNGGNITGFTYSIMNGTKSIGANSNGGSISELVSGTKYTFTVVAQPPSYSSITYSSRNISTVEIWTKSKHGESCLSASCDNDLTCQNNKICTCNLTTQYWVNRCYSLADIAIRITPTPETNRINLEWTVTTPNGGNITGFTYSIMNGTKSIGANSNGGSISELVSGTKYTFTVVAQPPSYSSITYSSRNISTVEIWTKSKHGESCLSASCDIGLTCQNNEICTCDLTTQYWVNRCYSLADIAIEITPTPETNRINLEWTVTTPNGGNITGFTYSIMNGTKSIGANSNGGSISELVSGTKYTFTVVAQPPSYTSITYSSRNIPTGEIWTKPDRPGPVINVTQVQNSNTYDITFGQSIGNVNKYSIDIIGKTFSSKTSNPTISVQGLDPGKPYIYSLYAENGNGDKSEFFTGTLSTKATASDPVSKVNVTESTNTSISINWHTPAISNGVFSGYIIQVLLNNSCSLVYRIHAPAIRVPDCNNYKDVEHFPDVLNLTEFNYTIENLKPYRNYTVLIAAVNEAGKGIDFPIHFLTKVGTPNNVIYVHVDNSTTNRETSVGLNITWTPGESTGPTNYKICLIDGTIQKCNVTDKTNFEFPNLLGYWAYNITVQASTEAGVSEITEPVSAKTSAKIPGLATFTLFQDSANATKLSIVLKCPDVESRNGDITKYIINILNLNSNYSESQTEKAIENCANKIIDLNNIKVENAYNVSVQVQNHVYGGSFSPAETIFVESRAPFLPPTRTIMKGSSPTTSEVKVDLCVSCILDGTQGRIVEAGLIVCLEVSNSECYNKQARKKRYATMAVPEGYDRTWLQSQNERFVNKYRATPDDWLALLNGSQSPLTYTIGKDSCNNPSNNFCNGPLPSNTKMKVTIVACTKKNCTQVSIDGLKTEAETVNTPAIVGGVVGGILGLAVIAAVVFLIIYFKRRPKRSRPSSQHLDMDKRAEFIQEHRPIKITDFKNHVKSLHKDSNLKFQDEFEDVKKLSTRFPHTSDEAKKESNRVKNRYVDILPYDHSRVKLEVEPEADETMDFINANYIPGYSSVREYIATQGPMHSTVPDFWRMVWEQKSRVIVMLSDLTEQGKPKVTLYWPENLGEPINYGNVIVEMTNFSQLNKYIIRNFKIAKGSETRKVTHFFLPGWWDFSANLTTSDVLEFAQLVRQEATPANSGPLIVHCSAGVGRTGTFIALDYFMQFVEKHSLFETVDVFGYVMKMRNNRPRMVQAETQYIFIFDALDEVIDRKIKLEQEKTEHVYGNGGELYANYPKAPPEENVYANTQLISEKNGIDNKAFESDYENLTLKNDKSSSPTTVL